MNAHRPLVLVSAGLLSKWGFDDGGPPDELLDVLEEAGFPVDDLERADDPAEAFTAWDRVLFRLVREFILPALDQRVEVVEIGSSHNPIRAQVVDGVDVQGCWYGDQSEPKLTPATVEVPMDVVVRMCAEAVAERSGEGT